MLFLWCYICPYYYSLGFWWVIVSLFQSYLESFRSNHWATQMAQQVKNPRAMQETQETGVWSLGWEDSLKKEMQPTPIFLPEKSNELRSLAGYSSKRRKESNTTKHAHHPFHNFNDINTYPAKQVLLFGLEHHLSFKTQSQLKLILISTYGYICSIWIKIGHLWGFSGNSVIKNLPTNAGDVGSVPDLGRSHMPQSN